ncbi:unnamed protein product, partial [Ectocarpus fasciculatus]
REGLPPFGVVVLLRRRNSGREGMDIWGNIKRFPLWLNLGRESNRKAERSLLWLQPSAGVKLTGWHPIPEVGRRQLLLISEGGQLDQALTRRSGERHQTPTPDSTRAGRVGSRK